MPHDTANPDVHWPRTFTPADADLFAHNEILIKAPPSTVWRHLVEAPKRPDWYPNSRDVKILTEPGDRLQEGSRFEFDTFGVRIDAEIGEFLPDERLGWFGHGTDIDAYHTWLLVVVPDGCQVVTEEVATGPGAIAMQEPDPEAMHKGHDLWLASLRQLSQQ